VKRVNLQDSPPLFIITLVEHQSHVNYRMAFRMLQYIVLILDAYEKELNAKEDVSGKQGFCYPMILPIVFYDGDGEWTAETNFLNKTAPNGPLYAKYIPTFEYMVVSLNKLDREVLLRCGDPLSFFLLVDKVRSPRDMELLENIPAEYVQSFSSAFTEGMKKVLMDVVTSLLTRADVPREEIDLVTNNIQERRYSEMFNRLEGYSVKETRREAHAEGRTEERRVWEEKVRQTESQRQQTERENAALQERIRFLEQSDGK
jgi:hypothetical protein